MNLKLTWLINLHVIDESIELYALYALGSPISWVDQIIPNCPHLIRIHDERNVFAFFHLQIDSSKQQNKKTSK